MKKILFAAACLIVLCAAAENDSTAADILPKKPGSALVLSAVIPGGGQYYNGKIFKGSVFAFSEIGLGAAAYTYYRRYDVSGANVELETAKRLTWVFAAVYVYSLMDAYVDAQLSFFPDHRLTLDAGPKGKGIGISYNF